MKIRYLVTGICIAIITILVLYKSDKGEEISPSVFKGSYSNYSANDFIKLITYSQNQDGGYPRLNEFDTKYDLYYLFHLILIQKQLGLELNHNEIANLYQYLRIGFLNNEYTRIYEYYYFAMIFESNIIVDSEVKDKLIDCISALRMSNGFYSYDSDEIKSFNDDESQYYLSTSMAMEAYKVLRYSAVDPNLNKWLEEKMKHLDKLDIKNSGHLLLLIKLSDLIEVNYDKKILEEKTDKLIYDLENGLTEESLVFLDPIIELAYKNNKIKELTFVYDFIVNLQDNQNGWFKNDSESNVNVLPTYIALKYFNYLNLEIPNMLSLNKKLNEYKIGDIPFYYQKGSSDLLSTYYVKKIIKETNSNELNDNTDYSQNVDFSRMPVVNKFFYFGQVNESVLEKHKELLLNLTIKDLDTSIEQNNFADLYYTLLNLESLRYEINGDDIEEIEKKIIENIDLKLNDNSHSYDLNDLIKSYYKSAIIDNLGLDIDISSDIDLLVEVIEMKNPLYTDLIDMNYELEVYLDIYELLRKLNITFNNSMLIQKITEATTFYGVIKSGTGKFAYISYKVTYVSLVNNLL
ncbi:hypothetical protein [Paenibacillus paeoniae]|uniref:Uncharacterized protein n=1 Tax=Paenibacillus paeoniae TaxID=2292705 RepID=A0A371PJA3_9BACL|nr:hypothetical protein [Paenibacillus paeoniae]REK76254.1 hypothetical protein DX130_04150 [Paenibacillus paeoniae]